MSGHEFSLPVSLRLPLRLGVAVYSLFIIWASLRPAGTGGAIPHMDKLLHLAVYAILGAGLVLAWPTLSKIKVFWICVVFGGLMEIGQGFMGSGRSASLWDGAANSLGAALGIWCVVLILPKLAR